MNRVYNFNPGPATLPQSVLQEAAKGIVEINNSGMSVLEVSHRGKDYEAIHFDARDRILKLMGLSSADYNCLFLGGGASAQFAMVPMNFLPKGASADYVHTGEWAIKAIKEAKKFGDPKTIASSEDKKFSYIPKNWKVTPGAKYVHITTNNTIEGTEYATIPDTGSTPLIADASSNILGRRYDFSKFSMIYAGAQKNLGPAGVCVVVARKSFIEQASEEAPTIFQYKTHAKNDSLYNTPPAFAIYMVGLVCKWIENQGGLDAMEKRNKEKAALIYSALDEYPEIYDPAVTAREDRSLMNITFRLRDATKEGEFLKGAEALHMVGLKGHRSVGGFRASTYNALPVEGCKALSDYIHKFARK